MTNEELIKVAIEAREKSYSPYSNWMVGAALETKDGKVYSGCNVENGGFSATNCAERTAFFKAISEGDREFIKIAIVGGDRTLGVQGYCFPCGVCRQVMVEFCNPDTFRVITARTPEDYVDYSLREMIPNSVFLVSENDYGFKPKGE